MPQFPGSFALPLLATAQRLRTECGPGWPAALPGVPCAAVSRGRQAAQRASTGMSMPFRPDRSPVEKPGPGSRTCRPWMGGKRQAGWPFSLVTFSLATQRESDSAAAGRRKLLPLMLIALNEARASRASALLQGYWLLGEVRCLPSQA